MWSSLLQRLFNIGKAKANDALDHIEDPVQMIKLATVELEQAIGKATKALAVAMANQKKLEKDHDQFKLESMNWYQKAAAALQSGKEDLAQKALTQKALADKKEVEYKLLAENAAKIVGQLQEQLDDYKLKLEELKTRQSIYTAKAESAKAQKQIAESLSGVNGSALANIEKYENTINQMEAEAESLTQLNSDKNKLEKEFKALENTISVQSDLDKLKEELALKSKQKEEQKIVDIQQMFDELNRSTNTNQLKIQPAPKEDINKKIDDFFNKK
ncbi:PspA/IM30 family protein [Xanthocytophaga flava]|uniref:PspA/IM30 family protein n=1 Tax=Xanthocytophaga flava TaxID=3048013 RepID=UPI0028D34AC5|nr:PspA/IM30 family protein [Xanthocytophaga flavus]MDJ1469506.1 PspA/IM30 family protein [Xanthocytophaga flavus]